MADIRRTAIAVPIADVGTAQTQIVGITEQNAGKIEKITHILGAAISVADSLIVISKNGTVLSGGTITVAYTSSAAGDVDYILPSNVYVAAGDYLTIANGGESTGAAPGCVVIDIAR